MTMNNAVHDQVIADVARELIAEVAPQELPIFRANAEAFFRDPDKSLHKLPPGKDDMLGMGIGEAVAFLTPVTLALVTEATQFLLGEVKKSVTSESESLISDRVKKLFKKFRSEEKDEKKNPLALTSEQLAEVRRLAYEKARQMQLPETQAALLADAMVGSLAVNAP